MFTRLKAPRLDSLFLSSKFPQVTGTDLTFDRPRKDDKQSQPWSHLVVLNPRPSWTTNHLVIAPNDITDKQVAVNPNFMSRYSLLPNCWGSGEGGQIANFGEKKPPKFI